jgi:peptidyl-tRNA hydrolase, PTH1 family
VTETATGAEPWVVVGLGNPGPAYAGHRHNVGYLVADELVRRLGTPFKAHRASRSEVAEARLGIPGSPGPRIVVVRPRGFMNELGGPTKAVLKFYGVTPERLVAVHDELDLPFDTMRVKFAGGDNGHNGLRSITRSLGSREYLRVRFGIGRPPGRMDPADYVLRDFSAAERKDLDFHLDRAADAVEALVRDGLESAQNRYND